MGLDFQQSSAHWSYSGFNRFRVNLANMISLDLNSMEGFEGSRSWDTVDDPISPLLNHSDCEGELSPEECLQVAPRLKELIASWKEDDYNKQQATTLAKDMLICGEKGESLVFC